MSTPDGLAKKPDKSTHDHLVSLVNQMLALHKSLQRQIDSTDRQIDRLVYQLYGLADDVIRIVEEATR
jgi:hypothetical protein